MYWATKKKLALYFRCKLFFAHSLYRVVFSCSSRFSCRKHDLVRSCFMFCSKFWTFRDFGKLRVRISKEGGQLWRWEGCIVPKWKKIVAANKSYVFKEFLKLNSWLSKFFLHFGTEDSEEQFKRPFQWGEGDLVTLWHCWQFMMNRESKIIKLMNVICQSGGDTERH